MLKYFGFLLLVVFVLFGGGIAVTASAFKTSDDSMTGMSISCGGVNAGHNLRQNINCDI